MPRWNRSNRHESRSRSDLVKASQDVAKDEMDAVETAENKFDAAVRAVPNDATLLTPMVLWVGLQPASTPPGLHSRVTHLRVKEEFTGPLCGLLLWEFVSDTQQAFIDYVEAVRKRAEVLGRHLQTTDS